MIDEDAGGRRGVVVVAVAVLVGQLFSSKTADLHKH